MAIAGIVATMLMPTELNHLPKGRLAGDFELAQYIRSHARSGDALAVNDIGQFGYYTRLRIIDTFGLVDYYVAHQLQKVTFGAYRPEDTSKLVDYVLGQQPRFIILKGTGQPPDVQIANETGARELHQDPRFRQRYMFVRAAQSNPYLLFERIGDLPVSHPG